MRVIVNRLHLADAMNAAALVIRARSPKPVLSCVLLTADTTSLNVGATDLEMSYQHKLGTVQVERAGAVCVPAEELRGIVGACDCDTLTIDHLEDTCHVYADTSHFKLPTFPAKDFPALPVPEFKVSFALPAGTVRGMIAKTAFAVSDTEGRYAFNGMLFASDGKRVEFVGCDGRRMAMAGEKHVGEKASGVVPLRAVNLIAKFSVDDKDDVEIQLTETTIIARAGDSMLVSSLIAGTFPPYDDIVPKDATRMVRLDANSFTAALRQSALVMDEDSKGVRMSFTKAGLTTNGRSNGKGEATVKYLCKLEGQDIEIGMNCKFVLEAVRAMGTDEVTLEMTEPNRPALLRGGPDALCVIMPVNLQ